MSTVTLAIPDLYDTEQSYEITMDGSKHGMGAHLTQRIKGKRRVIGLFSKSVSFHKRDWGQTKLELLSLFHAVKFWEPYLKGTHFTVKTDCLSLCNIQTIFTKKDAHLRRKIQSLADYSFTIEHISGVKNNIADFWSRYPHKKTFKDASTQCSESNYANRKVLQVSTKKYGTMTEAQLLDAIIRVKCLCNTQNEAKSTKANV